MPAGTYDELEFEIHKPEDDDQEFVNADGPNESLVEDNIQDSIEGFEDDDEDGDDDHDDDDDD